MNDDQQFARDLVTALAHPDYRDRRTIDVLRELKRERGEWV